MEEQKITRRRLPVRKAVPNARLKALRCWNQEFSFSIRQFRETATPLERAFMCQVLALRDGVIRRGRSEDPGIPIAGAFETELRRGNYSVTDAEGLEALLDEVERLRDICGNLLFIDDGRAPATGLLSIAMETRMMERIKRVARARGFTDLRLAARFAIEQWVAEKEAAE